MRILGKDQINDGEAFYCLDSDTIDDDLEFTVTFPTPSMSPRSSILDAEHDCEPVVFIFGWEGAEDEDLLAYTRYT